TEGHLHRVQALTGLPLDPMFPGSKFLWLLDRIPAGRSVRLGTVDSWLVHCLTGGRRHVFDASNAEDLAKFLATSLLLEIEQLAPGGIG
ncbi:FGGY family carbohydrate kinase, partial [Rhizobium ruizarguesonis]